MKISRDNYEIWFADWLENKLTDSQISELKSFLGENPDLEKEFSELEGLKLNPPSIDYQKKESLKRTYSDLTPDQFDLLCAAHLEQDLLPDQSAELTRIIASDPAKKRIADLFARTKLVPPSVKFPYRKELYSRTAGMTFLRLALPTLAAAAMIVVVMMSGVFRRNIIAPTGNLLDIAVNSPVRAPESNLQSPSSTPVVKNNQYIPVRQYDQEPVQVSSESTAKNVIPVQVASVEKIEIAVSPSLSAMVNLSGGPSYIPGQISETDDDRSRVGKFFAKLVREKVLDEKSPSETPLKGYEIAEAGITGINKLLGWDMALTRNSEDNGHSLKFNSRLLKFNTPVKNNEQGE